MFYDRRTSSIELSDRLGLWWSGSRFTTYASGQKSTHARNGVRLGKGRWRIQTILELNHSKKQLRSEEHTSELQSRGHLVCRLLLEKKKNTNGTSHVRT